MKNVHKKILDEFFVDVCGILLEESLNKYLKESLNEALEEYLENLSFYHTSFYARIFLLS